MIEWRAIDHVQLIIPEGGEDRARAFWIDGLGFAEKAKPEGLPPTGLWLRAGTIELHLGVDPDFRPQRKAHPALVLVDLDALRRALDRLGVGFTNDDRIAGVARLFFFDPFGNRIEAIAA